MIKRIFFSQYITFLLLSFGTAAAYSPGEDSVLARIEDKTITVNEFIMRAEYTVRPEYCRNNSNLDKKIILNSLIAEKLLSIEAGENNQFMLKPELQNYLLGRKEQAMRLLLYNDEVKSKVKPDSSKIFKAFPFVGRDYDIQYVNIKDSLTASRVIDEMVLGKMSFEEVLKGNYNLTEVPAKKVAWSDLEHPKILETLFTRELKKDELLGPVKIDEGEYMLIKINGWTDTPVITEKQRLERLNKINNTYDQIESKKIFEEYIRDLMKDKHLIFNEDVFFSFASIMGPLYMKNKKEQEQDFLSGAWKYSEEEKKYLAAKPQMDELRNKVLLTIDNEKWTVERCLQEIRLHPLVFRDKTFSPEQFGFQLQLAILDLVRDKYLTQEAYQKGYDKAPAILHEINVWKDNLNAVYEKRRILSEAGEDSVSPGTAQAVIEKILNPKIDELQKKYSDRIFINTGLFNNIKLTRIDMALSYSSSPYPQVVPGFPLLTTDTKLDYGKSMK